MLSFAPEDAMSEPMVNGLWILSENRFLSENLSETLADLSGQIKVMGYTVQLYVPRKHWLILFVSAVGLNLKQLSALYSPTQSRPLTAHLMHTE